MRARYTAHTDANIDFIVESHHPLTRSEIDRETTRRWAGESQWLGLEIRQLNDGTVLLLMIVVLSNLSHAIAMLRGADTSTLNERYSKNSKVIGISGMHRYRRSRSTKGKSPSKVEMNLVPVAVVKSSRNVVVLNNV